MNANGAYDNFCSDADVFGRHFADGDSVAFQCLRQIVRRAVVIDVDLHDAALFHPRVNAGHAGNTAKAVLP